jgi:hypothetical protein
LKILSSIKDINYFERKPVVSLRIRAIIGLEGPNKMEEQIGIISTKDEQIQSIITNESAENTTNCEEICNLGSEFKKLIEQNSDITSKFLSCFSKFYRYLDSLTLLQEVSLLHICMFSVLILTVFNILSVLFGNEILRFFKLEKRFPRLSVFFRIRATLQRYYLMWNVFILFVFCLFGIGINLLLFIKI